MEAEGDREVSSDSKGAGRLMKRLGGIEALLAGLPTIYLLIFFLIPLAIPFAALLSNNPLRIFLDIFRNPLFISLDPSGSLIEVYDTTFGGERITLILIRGPSYGIIVNSLLVALLTTIIASIIGVLLAILFHRYRFPGDRIFRILALSPLLAAPFASAYAVSKIFDWRYGLISYILNDVLGLPIRVGVESFAGIVLSQSLSLYPIVFLNTYSSMANIDPSLEEQARSLGAGERTLLRSITIPLSAPGIAAGSILVFILSIEDVGTPIVFKEDRMITYYIFRSFQDAITGRISSEAVALTLILLGISLAAFAGIRSYISLRKYHVIRVSARWSGERLSLWRSIAIYAALLPFLIFSLLPQIGVLALALSTRWTGPLPEGFSASGFFEIFSDPVVLSAMRNSLVYSIAAVSIASIISLLAGYTIMRLRIPGSWVLDTLLTAPLAIPGLAISMGFFIMFTSPPFSGTPVDPFVSGPGIAIAIAYSIRRLPFTARSILAGIQQLHPSMEEAGMSLGAGRGRVLANIVVPLTILNIASGSLIAFVYCLSEVSVSVTLGSLRGVSAEHQAPLTYIMQQYLDLPTGPQIVGALGATLMILQLIAIIFSNIALKGRSFISI